MENEEDLPLRSFFIICMEHLLETKIERAGTKDIHLDPKEAVTLDNATCKEPWAFGEIYLWNENPFGVTINGIPSGKATAQNPNIKILKKALLETDGRKIKFQAGSFRNGRDRKIRHCKVTQVVDLVCVRDSGEEKYTAIVVTFYLDIGLPSEKMLDELWELIGLEKEEEGEGVEYAF